ncbi:hypothetical protein A6R68_19323, partial [Neotoma lepida]
MFPFSAGAVPSVLQPRTRVRASPPPDLLVCSCPILPSIPSRPPDPRRSKRKEPERMAGAGSQHHPPGVAAGATAGAGAVSPTAAGPGEDSSDSEAEQEGPQKLIRKVSTSGQIRTKVRLGWGPAGELWVEEAHREIPGTGIRRRGAGARPGWGGASLRGGTRSPGFLPKVWKLP